MRALGQCTSASSLPTCGSKVGTQASPRGCAALDTGLKSQWPDGCGICGFQGLQTCEQITAWLQVLWACALRGGASVWADSQPPGRVQQSWHQICARGPALVALWEQCLRDTRANCLNFHGCGRAKDSAKSSVLWARTQVTATSQSSLHSGQLLRRKTRRLLSHLPPTAAQRQFWGIYSNSWGADCPWQGRDKHRPRRSPHSIQQGSDPHTAHRWKTQQAPMLRTASTPEIPDSHRPTKGHARKDTPLRSQQIAASPRPTVWNKIKWRSRGTTPN